MPTSARQQNKAHQSAGASPRPTVDPLYSAQLHQLPNQGKRKSRRSLSCFLLFLEIACGTLCVEIFDRIRVRIDRTTAGILAAAGAGIRKYGKDVKCLDLQFRSAITFFHAKIPPSLLADQSTVVAHIAVCNALYLRLIHIAPGIYIGQSQEILVAKVDGALGNRLLHRRIGV